MKALKGSGKSKVTANRKRKYKKQNDLDSGDTTPSDFDPDDSDFDPSSGDESD